MIVFGDDDKKWISFVSELQVSECKVLKDIDFYMQDVVAVWSVGLIFLVHTHLR